MNGLPNLEALNLHRVSAAEHAFAMGAAITLGYPDEDLLRKYDADVWGVVPVSLPIGVEVSASTDVSWVRMRGVATQCIAPSESGIPQPGDTLTYDYSVVDSESPLDTLVEDCVQSVLAVAEAPPQSEPVIDTTDMAVFAVQSCVTNGTVPEVDGPWEDSVLLVREQPIDCDAAYYMLDAQKGRQLHGRAAAAIAGLLGGCLQALTIEAAADTAAPLADQARMQRADSVNDVGGASHVVCGFTMLRPEGQPASHQN